MNTTQSQQSTPPAKSGAANADIIIGIAAIGVLALIIFAVAKSGKSAAPAAPAGGDKVVTLMSVADAKTAFGEAAKNLSAAKKAATGT